MKTNQSKSIKWLIALLALTPLLTWSELTFSAQMFPLPAEFWEQPRTGKAVLEQAALRMSVAALLEQPDGALVIHYASDEESLLRAEELRAWLIALAVEATQIELAGDLSASDELQIEIMTKRGK